MNITSPSYLGRMLVTASLAVCASCAYASSSWDLTACSDSTSLGNSETCVVPGDAAGLKLYGYSNASGTTSAPNNTNNLTTFSAAPLYDWGMTNGLGIISSNETNVQGPHAIENGYGIEAMMIQFSSGPVNLDSVTIGWNGTDNPVWKDNNGGTSGGGSSVYYNDSDLSVFAWNGGSAPSLTSTSPTGLMAANSGWTLVGNFADVGTGSNTVSPLGSALYSSYWLISAYSSAYGSGSNLGQGNDAFKVLALAGNTCVGSVTNGVCGGGGGSNGVPEPGSLALMGVALAGFAASRRRKQPAA